MANIDEILAFLQSEKDLIIFDVPESLITTSKETTPVTLCASGYEIIRSYEISTNLKAKNIDLVNGDSYINIRYAIDAEIITDRRILSLFNK